MLRLSDFPDIVASKILVTERGCWEWQGCRDTIGYGHRRIGGRKGKSVRLHVWVWEFVHGAHDGLCVLHKCDNPPCCNPDHLFLGTKKDNTHDAIKKGRLRPPTPMTRDMHPNAKIFSKDVAEIKRRYALGGLTQRQIAAEYGVSQLAIWKAIHA